MTAPLTAEQRAAYKTRADRMQEIVRDIEALERWRDVRVSTLAVFVSSSDEALADRAWKLGIDTLIAQLEQELADLDKPKGIERYPVVSASRETAAGEHCLANEPHMGSASVDQSWRQSLYIGWRKQADAITVGEYWLRWTSPDGLYFWLHPIEGRWVGEPEQRDMPTFPTYQKAYEASRFCERPRSAEAAP